MKILIVLPAGQPHKLELGPIKMSFREAPLTATSLAALIPEDLKAEVKIVDESVSPIPFHERFDLVITDMTMPKMTGENLARELFRIRPDVPIILCTGFSARMDEKKAAAMGIQAFISKPILKREIAEAIRAVLDGK